MTDKATRSLAEFNKTLRKADLWPFWEVSDEILQHEPCAPDRPHIWRWKDLAPFVDQACHQVPMDDAERRVMMLVNPAFKNGFTTTNLNAGIQILEPGEHAIAHRHTLSAMRFVIDGDGAATIVQGQRCPMYPGDLILTPNGVWHEHVNDTDRRVVWLDALDLPLTQYIGATFAEHGSTNQYDRDLSEIPDQAYAAGGLVPDTRAPHTRSSPMFRYPWERTAAVLKQTPAAADGARRLRYTNPVDGGPVIPTLDCYAWALTKGQEPGRNAARRMRLSSWSMATVLPISAPRPSNGANTTSSPCPTGIGRPIRRRARPHICSATPTAKSFGCSTSCVRKNATRAGCD